MASSPSGLHVPAWPAFHLAQSEIRNRLASRTELNNCGVSMDPNADTRSMRATLTRLTRARSIAACAASRAWGWYPFECLGSALKLGHYSGPCEPGNATRFEVWNRPGALEFRLPA